MGGKDLSGEILEDRYQIVERLSEGAMGVVYRGNRLKLDRAVAIKVMHASLPSAMEGRKRFEREAKLMAKLEHPHCVSIIDYGLHGAKPYVVMELVRGRSLHELLVEQRRFEIPRAVEIMRQVLSGLSHAHEQGIIHRDIKPANIMVTPKAPLGVHVRILDFGLARILGANTSTSKGFAVGTPSYMAPEQCRGEELDARVDIYACGVVLFEMLTGRKPFVAGDPIEIVKKQIQEAPPRLADVLAGDYGELETVVARALSKAPGDRFTSAVAMAEALDAAVSGRSAPEPTAVFEPIKEPSIEVPITVGSSVIEKPEPPGSSVRRQLPVSRMRYVVLGGLLLAGGAVAAGVVWTNRLARSEARTDHAPSAVVVGTPPAPAPTPEAEATPGGSGDTPAAPEAAPPAAAIAPEAAQAPPPAPEAATAGPAAPSAPAAASAPDPAADLNAAALKLVDEGKLQAAIDSLAKARRVYPQSALLAVTLGKLYFQKMWWADGLEHLRDAVKLDPELRHDPELIKTVLRGFLVTPGYDGRLGRFLLDLGANAAPLLDEAARTHPNPARRERAAALLRRIH
ncbi:MAG TPA: serine/threonine-protein kinase [Kofleriaceae bacterium]|nr:serine/threonine-protein kinase [Kofleriaceae bacterium]